MNANEKLHALLRRHLYAFASEHQITGFEAIGVLHLLAAEISCSTLVHGGLLAPGGNFADTGDSDGQDGD